MSPRIGAHTLLAALQLHEVDTLFGVPGHGAYPIYDALNDFPTIQPFVGRNEQGATFAAEGYARSSGRVAVATAVPKAGLTNAATSIWEANDQPSRMLFLLEADPTHRPILEPIARYYGRADAPDEIAPKVHELMWQLRTGRPGAAALEIPNAVLNAPAAGDPREGFAAPAPRLPSTSWAQEVSRKLARAERPLIVAGAPAAEAPEELTRLAEALQAPVFVDGRSKGAISDDHPLALGFSLSAQRAGGRMLDRADAVLLIGDRADCPREPTVQVDWELGHVPAILSGLAAMAGERTSSGWTAEEIAEVRRSPHDYAADVIPWATAVWPALRAAIPDDGLVFTDSLFGLWTARLFPARAARSFSFPYGTGTLGHAVPAALGARRAFPDRPIVAIAGDGAFLYNPQELATMMLYRQKLVVIVANDDCYGAVRDNTKAMFGRSIAHELRNPDFLSFGHAFGMDATRLRGVDELTEAVKTALTGERSALIELPLELRPPRF